MQYFYLYPYVSSQDLNNSSSPGPNVKDKSEEKTTSATQICIHVVQFAFFGEILDKYWILLLIWSINTY